MPQNVTWYLLLVLGLLVLLGRRWIPWLGQLPGDFTFHRGNLTVFVPLGTGLLVSIVLSILFAICAKR